MYRMKTRKRGYCKTKRCRKMKGGLFGLFGSKPLVDPQPVKIRKVYIANQGNHLQGRDIKQYPAVNDIIHREVNSEIWKINGRGRIGPLHDITTGEVIDDVTGNYVVYYINTDTIKKGIMHSDAPEGHPIYKVEFERADDSDVMWIEMHIANADEVENFWFQKLNYWKDKE